MIVNPNAGEKDGLTVSKEAARRFKQQNIEFEIMVSDFPGNSVNPAASLNVANFDGILDVGGDGTFFEVINGLFKNNNKLQVPIVMKGLWERKYG